MTTTPGWIESLLNVRYPPYEGKLAKFRKMADLSPDFDREGQVKFNLITYVLSLGAGSALGGVARYAVVLISEY